MTRSWPAWLILGLAGAAGCGSQSEQEEFAQEVVPVLERNCASPTCHGVPRGATGYSLDPTRWLTFTVDSGRIADVSLARASANARINSTEGVALSSFLRKTLPVAAGGVFHFQGGVFPSRANSDYQTLLDWAARVKDGTEEKDSPALTPLEERFATDVFPLLIQKGCATATCHGELNFGVSIFKAPLDPAAPTTITRRDLRESYRNARANLSLGSDPLQSRLLRKMLPLESGGIPHKGGNDQFFAGEVGRGQDPRRSADVARILGWLEAERAAALGAANAAAGKASALVFVGGPLPAAGPFDVPPFQPGSDLYRLDTPVGSAAAVNLTAASHAMPADVRSPAVSHDGRQLVFTMRTSAEDAHNVYTIGVDGAGLRQLTRDRATGDGGRVVANLHPIFGPSGMDRAPGGGPPPAERIYFVSTRGGGHSDDARFLNMDLWAMDLDGANLERLTYTVVPEVRPWFLASGEFSGTMAYTIKRSAEGGFKGVFFRFPIDHNAAFHLQPEAHPHFGMSEPPQVFYGLREMADGRSVMTLIDEGNRTGGGQLAVLERQFAVEVPEELVSKVTLPGFRHALTTFSPMVTRTGKSPDGYWRDPTPMPDGSIVAARIEGPVDLGAPAALAAARLVRIVLEEDRMTSRPRIKSMETLATPAGVPCSEPVAVVPRASEDEPHPRAWNDTDATGLVVHSGAQVIEAVLAQLTPIAARTVRSDLAFVRAVVPLEVAGPLPVQPVASDETRYQLAGATNLSLTGRMPLFSAVEVPPASDGSLAAKVPAKVPIRVVSVGADRMAIGALQHHWYAVLPGERFPVGIPESSFAARCAGCHGAMDGQPNTVLQPPVDAVTQASVTAALYDGADRRKPLTPSTIDGSFFTFVDFRRNVQPILTAKCATCHAGGAAPKGVTLTDAATAHYSDAYESLLKPGAGSANGWAYVDASGYLARSSYLAERLFGREMDAPGVVTGFCPPAGSPPLTDDERTTLLRWIEFGAAYVGAPGP